MSDAVWKIQFDGVLFKVNEHELGIVPMCKKWSRLPRQKFDLQTVWKWTMKRWRPRLDDFNLDTHGDGTCGYISVGHWGSQSPFGATNKNRYPYWKPWQWQWHAERSHLCLGESSMNGFTYYQLIFDGSVRLPFIDTSLGDSPLHLVKTTGNKTTGRHETDPLMADKKWTWKNHRKDVNIKWVYDRKGRVSVCPGAEQFFEHAFPKAKQPSSD